MNPLGTEGPFRAALNGAARLTTSGDRLELFGATGTRLAVFTAGAPASVPSPSELAGTSWQLVKFQGSDDTTLTPDRDAKYSIEFGADGRLIARVDCNRGRGTWKSSGSTHVEFGRLALTRAQCPPGSLHDQIVKQWTYIRSYVLKGRQLFLALMADGGIYEFERIDNTKRQGSGSHVHFGAKCLPDRVRARLDGLAGGGSELQLRRQTHRARWHRRHAKYRVGSG